MRTLLIVLAVAVISGTLAVAAVAAPPAAPTAAPAAAPEPPKVEVTKVVVQGIYRTRGICTARGEVTLTPQTFAFKAIEKSPLCSEETFGKSSAEFAWGDVSRVCYEYAATGAVQVWLKDGHDMSFKATRAEIEDLAARIKSLRPDLPLRCED